MADIFKLNQYRQEDLAALLKKTNEAIKANTQALQSSHNHLMKQNEVIHEYFAGVAYNTAIHAINSDDFPRTFLHGHAKALYPSKAVEKWIDDHTVYGRRR